jgi:heme-degrading monooxygenase HmoA
MSPPRAPLASFTVVRYSPLRALLGAAHMATQRPRLRRTSGLRFWQLLGSGSGIGFSVRPDLRTWALFAVWEDEAAWEAFRGGPGVMAQYRERGSEIYSLLMRPLAGHGRWDGVAPFGELPRRSEAEEGEGEGEQRPLAVLTRATIRLRRQLRFWSLVEPVDGTLRDHPDLLLSFGVGQVPFLRQATLSVWRSGRAMREWAYGSEHHREAVRRTRAENWYGEELFARLQPLRSYGSLGGRDPLDGVVPSAPA